MEIVKIIGYEDLKELLEPGLKMIMNIWCILKYIVVQSEYECNKFVISKLWFDCPLGLLFGVFVWKLKNYKST